MSASTPSGAHFAAKIPQQFPIALQYIRQILLQKHFLGQRFHPAEFKHYLDISTD
ncbi:hypothetical protein [Bradyrhizobium sp. WYCCWR 12699]|uniref:hypothetical protein n=1 Tax=Bradyrhizobium sp. WYCCWR 12699 TaxID=3064203 RepID=UPI0028A3E1F0|nr:hypothetical protein [Bradyrhizobium sp. WYCCWR 12699]MDT4738907.1 hypothetical protein [Bradyrhizobium sp. WYCCWR 12699]